MSQLARLEAELNELSEKLLLPLRISKTLDSIAMTRLYSVVDELAELLHESESISRRLAGNLWFVFAQMLMEADHARDPDPILRAAWAYHTRLYRLFGAPPPVGDDQ